jgi:hypothetical protein
VSDRDLETILRAFLPFLVERDRCAEDLAGPPTRAATSESSERKYSSDRHRLHRLKAAVLRNRRRQQKNTNQAPSAERRQPRADSLKAGAWSPRS